MATNTESLRGRLPAPDLQQLSLVKTDPASLKAWVAALPLVNTVESAPLVHTTLQEINRLRVDESLRFQLLEIIRPPVQSLCQALGRYYLNNNVVLSEQATKVATLAQALQNRMAVGYKLVVANLLDAPPAPAKRGAMNPRDMLLLAMHRAMSNLAGTLLRVTELYLNAPPGLWQELHALYLLAVEQGLAQARVSDPEAVHVPESTVEQAYVRALLLATCKPNQLRQAEIIQIHTLTELWAPLVQLKQAGSGNALVVYDLGKDEPPASRGPRGNRDPESVRAIDPVNLVRHLEDLQRQPAGQPDGKLPGILLQHLIGSWSELSERGTYRKKHETSLELCLGLLATHYYLGNRQDFHTQLRGRMDLNDDEQRNDGKRPERFTVSSVDISAGGYGITWNGAVPNQVKVGELVGVRESGQMDWNLGVIRWVKPIPGSGGLQLGLEILAPTALPCGSRLLRHDDERTDFMRTLLVPELKALKRPATLITPTVGFQSGSRISIVRNGKEEKGQLTRLYGAAHSFRQFEFQLDSEVTS